MLIILFYYLRIYGTQHFVYISDFQTKDISIKPENLIPNNPSLNR